MAIPEFNASLEAIRSVRSIILTMVNSAYPRGLYEDVISEAMLELPEPVAPDYVSRDLGYLADHGLIAGEFAHDPRKAQRVKARIWKLTARGVTFLERGMPWVEIERLS